MGSGRQLSLDRARAFGARGPGFKSRPAHTYHRYGIRNNGVFGLDDELRKLVEAGPLEVVIAKLEEILMRLDRLEAKIDETLARIERLERELRKDERE